MRSSTARSLSTRARRSDASRFASAVAHAVVLRGRGAGDRIDERARRNRDACGRVHCRTVRTVKLKKSNPTVEVTIWTDRARLGWLKVVWSGPRAGSTKGNKSMRSPKQAQAAFEQLLAKYSDQGFEEDRLGAPTVVLEPSKPRGTPRPPAWLAKLPSGAKQARAKLRALVDDAKLSHRAAEIEALLLPGIGLDLEVGRAAPRRVVSRIGGDPDLPVAFLWPDGEDGPLGFVAQIVLAEVAKWDVLGVLPKVGVLTFFASLEPRSDYGQLARVAYFPSSAKLTRRGHPPGTRSPMDRVGLLAPELRLTLPDYEAPELLALKLTKNESVAYHDQVFLNFVRRSPVHQLLGHGSATTRHSRAKNRLLAQFDTDRRIGFNMGDCQTLWIHVDPKRLSAQNFDRVVCCIEQA